MASQRPGKTGDLLIDFHAAVIVSCGLPLWREYRRVTTPTACELVHCSDVSAQQCCSSPASTFTPPHTRASCCFARYTGHSHWIICFRRKWTTIQLFDTHSHAAVPCEFSSAPICNGLCSLHSCVHTRVEREAKIKPKAMKIRKILYTAFCFMRIVVAFPC